MGKKRKRKNKPEMDPSSEEEKLESNEEDESSDEDTENTENNENSDSGDEQRKSRRQKIAEIDRTLARNLEAREAGKKKDLRDPVTRFFQESGKTAVKYKNTISIALMVIIVILFLIAYNVVTKKGAELTVWSRLSAENNIDVLRGLASDWEGLDVEPYLYRKIFYAYDKDKDRSLINKLKGKKDIAEKFLEKFDDDSDQKDFCNLLRSELTKINEDLDFLEKRKAAIEKGVTIPEHKAIVLPSDSKDTLEVGLVTDFGTIKLELFDKLCPNAVSAFMYLVQEGFYQEDGLGGSIKRTKTSNSIERLVIGEMPATDSQNQTKTYNDLKDIDERVSKLNKKWEELFNKRINGLGWNIPLEPDGLKQSCEKGAILAWLTDESDPESASYKFSILLNADEELTGKYMVIGSIKRVFEEGKEVENKQQIIPNAKLDPEAFAVASQINVDGVTINYSQILKTKAERIYTDLFVKNGDKYVAVDSVRYFTKQNGKEFVVGSPDKADYILANPGMYTFIAKDSYYKNDEGKIVKAEKDMYIPVFPEEMMDSVRFEGSKFLPLTEFRTSFINQLRLMITKELPVYKEAINEEGELLGTKFMPMVKYKDLPMVIEIRKKAPPKTEPFVFTRDESSPLYFEGDIDSANANSRPPSMPNPNMPNPNGININGPNGNIPFNR